jgi:hypothetical protein
MVLLILDKDNTKREQKQKSKAFLLLPRCRLSYSKISKNLKQNARYGKLVLLL